MEDSLIINKIMELEKSMDRNSDIYLSVQEFEAFVDSMQIKVEKKQLVIRQSDYSYCSIRDIN